MSFAQSSVGQVEQSERLIEKGRALRERIRSDREYYIESIVVKGGSVLSDEEIGGIVRPFLKKRLTEKDIGIILDSVRSAYSRKGWRPDRINFEYTVVQKTLEIYITEDASAHNPEEK